MAITKAQQIKSLRRQGKKAEADLLAQGGATRQEAFNNRRETGGRYTVQSGDSWFSIAGEKFGNQRFFEQLQLWNPYIQDLRPGMVIRIPRLDTSREPLVSYRAATEAGLDTSAAFSNLPSGATGTGTPTPYLAPVAPSPGAPTPPAVSTNDFDLKRILAGNLAPQPLGMPRVNYNPNTARQAAKSDQFAGREIGAPIRDVPAVGFSAINRDVSAIAAQYKPPYVSPPRGPGYSNQPQVFTPQQAEAARLTLEAAFGGTPATVEGLKYTPQFPPFISNQVIQTIGDPNITAILQGVGYQQVVGGYELSKEAQAILGVGSSGTYSGESFDLGPYSERMREVRVSRGQRASGGVSRYLDNGASNFYGGAGGVINWRIGFG